MNVYIIPIAVWVVASVPFSLAIGKIIAAGKRGEEDRG